MKITIKKEKTEEIEVTFPVFKKDGCHNIIAVSENECIMVTTTSVSITIQKYNYIMDSFFTTDEDSNEDEFMAAYNNAQEIFKGILL